MLGDAKPFECPGSSHIKWLALHFKDPLGV